MDGRDQGFSQAVNVRELRRLPGSLRAASDRQEATAGSRRADAQRALPASADGRALQTRLQHAACTNTGRASARAGHDPKPKEIAAHCGVSIYAAQRAVARYRAGRLPVAKSAGLAPKTVKNVHRMLHRALADAVAWRYLEYNPAEHASLPRESRKGTRNRGTTWTPEELAAWLAVAVQDRDAGIWVLAATTGMRRSELAGAERDLLDLDAAVLEIGDTRVVVDGKAEESDGKTESGRRTISLDTLTVDYLRRHLAMLDAEKEAFGGIYRDSGKLVRHPDGTQSIPTRSPGDSTG